MVDDRRSANQHEVLRILVHNMNARGPVCELFLISRELTDLTDVTDFGLCFKDKVI